MIFQPSGYSISYKQNDFHMTKVQYISHKWLNWGMNFWPHGSYSGVCRHYATKNFESWPLTFEIDTNRFKQIVARNLLFTCICTKRKKRKQIVVYKILDIKDRRGREISMRHSENYDKKNICHKVNLIFFSLSLFPPIQRNAVSNCYAWTNRYFSFKSRKGIAEVFKIDWQLQLNLSCVKNQE